MARTPSETPSLSQIEARRKRLVEELEALEHAEREARERLADAGRETLLAALAGVKIGPMTRAEAKKIASSIAKLGGAAAAVRLANGE